MKIAYIAETYLNNRSAYTHHVIKMWMHSVKKLTTLIIPYIKKINLKNKKKLFTNFKKKFLVKLILNFKVSNFLTR